MMSGRRWGLGGLLAVSMLIGCAAMPPAQAAHDLKDIAGKWEGSVINPRGEPLYSSTLTISGNGTYELLVPALSPPGPRFVGTVAVVDGQFRWKDEDGRTEVFTLHEGGGERVLTSDGGGTVGSAKWERAW